MYDGKGGNHERLSVKMYLIIRCRICFVWNCSLENEFEYMCDTRKKKLTEIAALFNNKELIRLMYIL